jgi:hypothetical protein
MSPLPVPRRSLRAKIAIVPAVVAAMAVSLAAPAGAGIEHVSGVQSVPNTCSGPVPGEAGNAMAGSLVGCWITDTFVWRHGYPNEQTGALRATGTEHFVGCLDVDGDGSCGGGNPSGTLGFTFNYQGKWDYDHNVLIWGRCEHPIVSGSGAFTGATGRIHFVDDPASGTASYAGHVRLSTPRRSTVTVSSATPTLAATEGTARAAEALPAPGC